MSFVCLCVTLCLRAHVFSRFLIRKFLFNTWGEDEQANIVYSVILKSTTFCPHSFFLPPPQMQIHLVFIKFPSLNSIRCPLWSFGLQIVFETSGNSATVYEKKNWTIHWMFNFHAVKLKWNALVHDKKSMNVLRLRWIWRLFEDIFE